MQPAPPPYDTPLSPVPPQRALNPKRGRGFVVAGVIMLLLGTLLTAIFGGFAVWKLTSSISAINNLVVVDTPENKSVLLTRGEHDVWFINKGSAPSVAALPLTQVTVTSVETGKQILISLPFASKTWSIGERRGVRIGSINIPKDGMYRIDTENVDADQIGIGNVGIVGFVASIFAIFGAVGSAVALAIPGIVLLIVGIVKRKKTKRALAATGQAPY